MEYSYILEFEKETPGTVRYSSEINGRKETMYVPKSRIEGQRPSAIKVTVTDASD